MAKTFGKYELLGELGAGGMAVVYKARDTMLDRVVALKVISQRLQGGEAARKRFLNEARVAAVLNHSNIVAVYELGVEDGFPYIAMEYLPGEDLRDVIEENRPLNIHQKLNIALQIARALEHAHSRGVIHRDIKPGNIRILQTGGVKLMDFGIAKVTSAELTRLTRTGAVMGTAAYMSPEQLRGENPTEAADVFAFGIVLYELLSFRKPFEAPHPAAMVYRILNTDPPPLEAPDVPPELVELVDACLKKQAEERIANFGLIVRRLSAVRKALRQTGPRTQERTDAPLLTELATDGSELPDSTEELDDAEGYPESTQTFTDLEPTWRYAGQVKETTGSGPQSLMESLTSEVVRQNPVRRLIGIVVAIVLLAVGAVASYQQGWFRRGGDVDPHPVATPIFVLPAQPTASPTTIRVPATQPPDAGSGQLESLPSPKPIAEPSLAPTSPPTEAATVRPTETATIKPTEVPSPTEKPTNRPPDLSSPTPVTVASRPTEPVEDLQNVRIGGAPEGTVICMDQKVRQAARAGLAFILEDVPLGNHRVQLWHPEKGVADKEIQLEAGKQPFVVLFKSEEWRAPSFTVHLQSAGEQAGVLEFRDRSAKDKTWTGYREKRPLKPAAGGGSTFEGLVREEYRIETESGKFLSLGFQWIGKGFEAGELKLENSEGVLSTKRCLWKSDAGACSGIVALDCGALD